MLEIAIRKSLVTIHHTLSILLLCHYYLYNIIIIKRSIIVLYNKL